MNCSWIQSEDLNLYRQSMDAVANFICQEVIQANTLKMLPINCRETLFVIMCRRGKVNESNIKYLIHRNTSRANFGSCFVSNLLIEALSEKCPYLSELDISSKNQIDCSYLKKLFAVSCNLRKVQMQGCDFLTPSTVRALVQNCGASLLLLNVGDCSMIDDSCLEAISNNCLHLQCLTASGTQITDDGVKYLMNNGSCVHSLLELDISHSKYLTDVAVELTVRACKKLTIFVFHGCPLMAGQSQTFLETVHGRNKVRLTQVTWTIY